jgi:hypothetical protein
LAAATPIEEGSTVQLIDADSESTWPETLLRCLDAHRQALADFQVERARIDRAADKDETLREDRPSNPHQAAWDAVLELPVAIHISRLASKDAAKSLLSTLVSESSGECRLGNFKSTTH